MMIIDVVNFLSNILIYVLKLFLLIYVSPCSTKYLPTHVGREIPIFEWFYPILANKIS